MKMHGRRRLERGVVVGALAIGLMAGSYGIASAASGSSSSHPNASSAQRPWGVQRSDETLLSGDTAAKVMQAALTKLLSATIVRVETDADGHAAYEAHVVESDGTPATVYVNEQFAVVSVQTGMPGPGPAYGKPSSSSGTGA
jgi:hypothetical protein